MQAKSLVILELYKMRTVEHCDRGRHLPGELDNSRGRDISQQAVAQAERYRIRLTALSPCRGTLNI